MMIAGSVPIVGKYFRRKDKLGAKEIQT